MVVAAAAAAEEIRRIKSPADGGWGGGGDGGGEEGGGGEGATVGEAHEIIAKSQKQSAERRSADVIIRSFIRPRIVWGWFRLPSPSVRLSFPFLSVALTVSPRALTLIRGRGRAQLPSRVNPPEGNLASPHVGMRARVYACQGRT